MLLNFILLTLSIVLGIILAMVVMFVLMLQPWVIKFYSKLCVKYVEDMTKFTEEQMKDL